MALTYNSINMQYAIPWNTIKAALCNMSERTFIRKRHFSCSWLLITQMIPGLLFDCWLVVCSKSQVTRYDVHWNPLLACFLSPRGRWGGVEVLGEAEDQSSSCRAAPQWRPSNLNGGFARRRAEQIPAWFYASVHKKDIIDEGVYFASCEWGKRLRRCDQMIKFDHLIRWCIRGCSSTSPRPPSSSPSTRWPPPMWCYSDRRSRGYCSGNYRRNKFSWSCWVEESIEETRRR